MSDDRPPKDTGFSKRILSRSRALLHRVETRVPPGLRLLLGLVLMVSGIFGFLPVIGFWMFPLGVAIVAMDIRPLWQWIRNRFR